MYARSKRHVFGLDRRSPQIDSLSDFEFERAFRALPEPTGPYPFRLPLDEILGPDEVNKIAANKQLVFHSVGDTGRRIYGGEAQDAIAEHMVRQLEEPDDAARPRFFYHLGDVIYFHGQRHLYEAEFYEPYQHYTAPIFAIPGNHDGAVLFADTPLQGFMENFCSAQPTHTWPQLDRNAASLSPCIIRPIRSTASMAAKSRLPMCSIARSRDPDGSRRSC